MRFITLLRRPVILVPTALLTACLLAAGIASGACAYLGQATQALAAIPLP
ncbi:MULTISPECIES: hypothetical protein [unclassified Leucobacter]